MSADAQWNRFAQWPRLPARVLLAVIAVLMVLAALVDYAPPPPANEAEASTPNAQIASEPEDERDDDLRLYDSVIAKIGAGENYYAAAVAELRARGYPVRPGLVVRVPTLAFICVALGSTGMRVAAFALLAALGWAWWRKLGAEPGAAPYRNFGAALVLVGASLLINPDYLVLHELWAGALVALSLALHRPDKWWPALIVAALALAIRELALPYVLLMAALAFWRRDWREGAAWSGLALLFCALLAWHIEVVAGYATAADPPGPSWLALRGLAGFIGNIVMSSRLEILPQAIAGPLVILSVAGWAGWRTRTGTTATLLCLGYALAFMIAGRTNNFYWGLMLVPVLPGGLAFAPVALRSLWRAAR